MKRGTRVAQAYTEMHVDGSDMDKEIVDAVDGAGPGVEKAGREQGDMFGDAFGKSFADRISKKIGKQLDKSLTKSFSRTGKNIGRQLSDAIENSVGDAMLEVSRMLDTLKDDLSSVSRNVGSGGGGSTPSVGSGGPLKPPPSEQRYMQAAYKANKDFEDAKTRIIKQAEDARARIWDEARKENAKRDQKAANDYTSWWSSALKTQDKMLEAAAKHHDSMVKKNAAVAQKFAETRVKMQVASNLAIEKDDARLISAQQALYARLEKENAKRDANETRLRSNRPGMGDRIGRLFGAGSRNNFLNTFGNSLGGIVNLTEKVGGAASKLFGTFSKGFTEGTGLLDKFSKGFAAIGSQAGKGGTLLSSIAASGPGAAAAIAAVVVALSILVSVMGALLALATALTATIVGGLTAGLAVLGGAIFAVVAAGGLLTAAFMSMTDAQKGMLKDAFRPLREEMVGLGQIMIQQMVPAFSTWSVNLQRALALAEPVARAMGQAFAEAGKTLTASFSGPGFQQMATALGTFLPSIVNRLAGAFGNFLNGTMSLFAALMPYVDRFAGYLERVTSRFATWAASAGGQNAIASFMDRALVSLQSLWNAVREFSGVLVDLLFSPQAMSAGNTIFDGLAATFEDLRAYIARAAANGDLKKWFDDGIEFGRKLWDVIQALIGTFRALYSSGVLGAFGDALGMIADVVNFINPILGVFTNILGYVLPPVLMTLLGPIGLVVSAFDKIGGAVEWVAKKIGLASDSANASLGSVMSNMWQVAQMAKNVAGPDRAMARRAGDAEKLALGAGAGALQNIGRDALKGTDIKKAKPAKYVNPYKKLAESLMSEGPTISAQIKTALQSLKTQINEAMADALSASDGKGAQSSLKTLSDSVTSQGQSLVDTARSGLNSAAQALSSASSKGEASKALKKVREAQKGMEDALKAQKRLDKAAQIVRGQQKMTESSIQALLSGNIGGQTLAEFAEARARLSVKIEEANQKLVDAIAMRDQYQQAVSGAAKAFAALTTAQAKTVNGVQQALTAGDITDNLKDRLEKVRTFQNNLRLLLANGLSNEAYKQILDEGVEGGSAYADALLKGGSAAIGEVNGLVSQIDAAANGLGTDGSNRLYQAGVNAAQGLVDGLTSLGAQLDRAAASLGTSIANSLKRALGIASPSRVMIAAMGYVGDGIEKGLDEQTGKAVSASARLSKAIQVSPEVAQYAASQGESPYVSRNGGKSVVWNGNIVTPTEDPHAVATEMLDELVERLS